MHSGHEFTSADMQCFNRIHMYLVPYELGNSYDTINAHRTKVQEYGLSFSPALHFIPRPGHLPVPVSLPYLFA